ncbi:MAG TPA: hypothetical protein PLO57_10240, partial [Candidatus Cloacimonadota bacterium]|nr:hypothetical protein [Candidatus Cloacimonadota bacterium]
HFLEMPAQQSHYLVDIPVCHVYSLSAYWDQKNMLAMIHAFLFLSTPKDSVVDVWKICPGDYSRPVTKTGERVARAHHFGSVGAVI